MKVFKFGGASLKTAAAIRNMASIVKSYANDDLIIVVSAMGKTTNLLETVLYNYPTTGSTDEIQSLKKYHLDICMDLFKDSTDILTQVNTIFEKLTEQLTHNNTSDQQYDQVVSLGEILSSLIVASFLQQKGINAQWVDARKYILTDDCFREGKVQWESTKKNIQSLVNTTGRNLFLTQGFIGAASNGLTTTLGREGSDFTAAIFAACLQAESVTIWKDVPGVMTADPKRIPGAQVFKELPFKEAAEMTYYGASVIHPKTIQPLALQQIPLLVKCFDDPSLPGTRIHECKIDHLPPLIVFKDNQCLISCKVTDYTFVNEHQLSIIFDALSSLDIKINVMQNSAISFSFCIDFRESKLTALVEKLKNHFEVYYNTGLTLITIKNYDEKTFDQYRKHEGVLIEQSSRSTLQLLVKL